MAHAYVVSANKPSAATFSAVGSFTSPEEKNLVVAYGTRIEISLLTPEGISPLLDVPIYGRIAAMFLIRLPGETQDVLFVCTERRNFCVLEFDAAQQEITTRASGNAADRVGMALQTDMKALVDTQSRCVALHMYEGILKLIPIKTTPENKLEEAFNVRLQHLNVLDMVFLHGPSESPILAYLYKDPRSARHVKTFHVMLRDKDLKTGPWELPNVEAGSSKLIALEQPVGGVIVVGETSVTYYNGETQRSVPMNPTEIEAIGRIDATRYLMADYMGTLSVLAIEQRGSKLTDIKIQTVGSTSVASTLSYLDSGAVFVGSALSDSQLIRLRSERDAEGQALEVLESYPSIGPILDMAVVTLDNRTHLVTCSGAFKFGSLRVVRVGMGFNMQAELEIAGIKGLFSLAGPRSMDGKAQYLVQSFVQETRVLGFAEDGGMEEAEVAGLDGDSTSLACRDVMENQAVQVTPKAVRLLGEDGVRAEWKHPEEKTITVAAVNQYQVALSVGQGSLYILAIANGALTVVGQTVLENEIACLDITPHTPGTERAHIVAVGLWKDMSVRLLSLPDFREISKEIVVGDVIARSVALCLLEDLPYLLVGMGDGNLVWYPIDPNSGVLGRSKHIPLGTQPVQLQQFSTPTGNQIFASCDRPAVIYSQNRRLLCYNVNFRDVSCMCAFDSVHLPGSLAVASSEGFYLGSLDTAQKLHIRSVPIETPRRIVHSPANHCFLVSSTRQVVNESKDEIEECHIVFVDDRTLEVRGSFELDVFETGAAMTVCSFSEGGPECVAVSTGYVYPDETDCSKGRVLILQPNAETGEVNLLGFHNINGCGYTLSTLPNNRLIVGANSQLEVFSKAPSESTFELSLDSSMGCGILNVFSETRGDMVLVGDLMKSVSVLQCGPDGMLKEVARDFNPHWMVSGCFLSEDHILGADNFFNFFIAQRNSEASNEEERRQLDHVGEYHTGEFVNVIRPGAIATQIPDPEITILGSWVFGTVSGTIGLVVTIQQPLYEFFSRLQHVLAEVIKGVGSFSHSEYRSFYNEHKQTESKGIVDGDLVECFLLLTPEKMTEVAAKMECSVEDIARKVEAMQRLH